MKSLSSFICESFKNGSQDINENECAVNWCADPSFSNDPEVFADEFEGYLGNLEGNIDEKTIKRIFHPADDKLGAYMDIAYAVIADARGIVDLVRDEEMEVMFAIEILASYASDKSERIESILDFNDFEEADVKNVFKNWNKFVKAAIGNEWVDARALQKDHGIRV